MYDIRNRDLKSYNTPYEKGVRLKKSTDQASIAEIRSFQQQIGSLLYLALKTRPDIAFPVNKLSRFMTNPDKTHFKALDRIWSYLYTYQDLGLFYRYSGDLFIKIYCDSDWASNLDDRKSTQAYVMLICDSVINWNIKLQKTVVISFTEAEYMALKSATSEAIYIINMLRYLTEKLDIKLANRFATILMDNLGAKGLAESKTFYEKSKHIDISYHFSRNAIEDGYMKVCYISDKFQLADPLTKGVDQNKLN
jgi:hypothetical protein